MESIVDDSGGPKGGPTPTQGDTPVEPRQDTDTMEGNLEAVMNAENVNTEKDGNLGNENNRSIPCGVLSENIPEIDSSDCAAINGKRKRNRRKQKGGRHHRKWKPYDKLTWDERKTLEDRETKRACKKRESRFASGQAMAPYNTTQFLMEQHEPSETGFNLEENRPARERMVCQRMSDTEMLPGNLSFSGGSGDGSSEDDSNEEGIFLEKDFTEAYEQYQSERLENMTKGELVREHLLLEEEVESLKKQLKLVENENRRRSSGSSQGTRTDLSLLTDDVGTIQVLQLIKQVKKLKQDNESLKLENDKLVAEPNSNDQPTTMDVAT